MPTSSDDELSADNGAIHVIFGTAATGLAIPDNQFFEQFHLSEFLEQGDRVGAALGGR